MIAMRITWDARVGMEMTSSAKDDRTTAREGSDIHGELGIKM